MRQITKKAVQAFMAGKSFKLDNTLVFIEDGVVYMRLYNTIIAQRSGDQITIQSHRWQTNTTKERLNGIPGVSISQKNFQWYLNGEIRNGERKTI